MDHWVTRRITESTIIGGNEKTLYEIGPDRTLTGNTPYINLGHSPWATSNVMAKVMGLTKTNQSVYRDAHGKGYCAKLTTHIEHVKVLGMINISVLALNKLDLVKPKPLPAATAPRLCLYYRKEQKMLTVMYRPRAWEQWRWSTTKVPTDG